jgi:hypothetical protein
LQGCRFEAADARTLHNYKNKGVSHSSPRAVAAHLLLALLTAATAARPALRTSMPNQATALIFPVGGVMPVTSHLRRGRSRTRMHCHQVIKLSNTLPAIALGKKRTCTVHGVQVEYLMGGGWGRGGNANNFGGGVGGGAR